MASPTQVEPLPPPETESPLLSSINQLSVTGQEVKNAPKKTNETQERRVESGYTRRPYVPKPVVVVEPVEPVVEHSELREVAAHVRRRDDNKVTALPPPLSKKGALSKTSGSGIGGGGKDEGELGPGKPNDDGGDDGNGDDHDEAGGAGSVIEQESDTDDEYQSASEEQWPEDTWNDDPALVRDIVPTSQKDISSAIDALKMFLALKKKNFEAVKTIERDLESRRDDLLMMGDASIFEAIASAKADLTTLHRTLLENDDTVTQEEIRIDLEKIASRTDQLPKHFHERKDNLRKAFVQQAIAEEMTSGTAASEGAVVKMACTWNDRRSYRLSKRLNLDGPKDGPLFFMSYALFAYMRSVWRVRWDFQNLQHSHHDPIVLLGLFWASRVSISERELRNAGWVFRYPGVWRPADLNLKEDGQYVYIPELPSEYVGSLTIEEKQWAQRDAGDDSLQGTEGNDTTTPSV
ncbi:hypothetical protein ACEPPN_007230 [Leptodophora sp. 'Broadleaf-Isolate-01']